MALAVFRAIGAVHAAGALVGTYWGALDPDKVYKELDRFVYGALKTFAEETARKMGLSPSKQIFVINAFDLNQPNCLGNGFLFGPVKILLPSAVRHDSLVTRFVIARQIALIRYSQPLARGIVPLIIGIAVFVLLTSSYPIGACIAGIAAFHLTLRLVMRVYNHFADLKALQHVDMEVLEAVKKVFESPDTAQNKTLLTMLGSSIFPNGMKAAFIMDEIMKRVRATVVRYDQISEIGDILRAPHAATGSGDQK